jgi:signal transduction histidine kinase
VEQANYLNAIKNSADNLKVIINDILDFSIIESGKLMLEKIGFNLNYQVQSVIDSLMVQAKEKRLSIELTNDVRRDLILLGDPVRLSQILINLINNAIKFTHKGKITINITSSEPRDNITNVTFKVIDTGIGIEKEKIKTIFDTFKQADESITRKFGGTGLGLTISKQLVELQGGKLSVTSELNVGTTFTFVIPYAPGSNEDIIVSEMDVLSIRPKKTVRSLAGMRVLLVEDNDINRMYAATILKKWHCILDEAENGQIALEKIRKQDYDLILMDIHMPILDGIEAARSIRTSFPEPKSEVPIIAFTANALKGDKDKYLSAGMNSYISKPFMPDELFNIMSKFYNVENHEGNSSSAKTITDLSSLRKMSNNDESFVQEMVSSFIEKTPEIIKQIKHANKEKNWQEVGAMAHKLKPNLAFMGIDSLKKLIAQIETNANNNKNTKAIPGLIKKLTSSINVAIKELDS